jgi:excisionase family DNA binding protein
MEKVLTNHEPLMTTNAVAKWLGIAPRTVCLWAEYKEIPAIKIGRQWRFREGEVSDWLRNAKSAKIRLTAAAV